MVCRLGASKPVSHMSRTSTICKESSASRNRLASASRRGLLRMCGCQSGRIGGGAGHHHLEPSLAIIFVMPFRAQAPKLAIEVDANPPAHADDHRLAVHRFKALVEVGNDVPGDELQAPLGPDNRFELRPLGLELLLALDFLTLGCLLEAGVDLGPLVLIKGQLGEPALVVDRHRGAVLYRPLDVVDADVIAEHGAGVGVLQLDRGCR